MKPVSSILSADRGRGQMAVIIAILLAALAVFATMALTGDGRSPAEADSLAAPLAQAPHDPPTSGSTFVRITANGEELEGESVYGFRASAPGDAEGWTDVLEYNHSIMAQSDRSTGLPTGRRSHNAIIITKRIDKSSPQLLQALDSNHEVDVVLEVERINSDSGEIETYYRISAEGGRITGIRKNTGLVGGDTETISIIYQTLTEENLLFSTQASVDANFSAN